ncbi:MAG: O-antigen ligase family protein [Xanthobacteraceae bacterium]
MTTLSTSHRPLSFGLADGERLIRDALFLATFLLTWFTATPFPDLSASQSLAASTGGDLLGQVLMLLLTGALAAFALVKRLWLVPRIVTLPLVLTLGVFAISAMHSAYPDLAMRRLVLAVFIIFQSSMFLLLPCGREHFARMLAVAAIIVLAACYLGVAFIPQLSIHQATDIAEPNLAGDWRGFFTHKNGAGAAMVLLIFMGIFIARAWNRLAGISIIVLAAIFLYFTHAKSPLNLLAPVLILSYLAPRLRNSMLAFALVVAGPILLNLLTIGSVMFGAIKRFDAAIMSDPTFTGRDVIWSFALDHVPRHPLFGFGFESFWGMPDLVAEWNYLESWGYRASDAHNGYLNLAVTVGPVGLALALWWIVVPSFIDYRRALALGVDRALTTLFIQIWIFALCLSSFESVFFAGGSALWSLTVMAIAGLRFQTLAKTAG